MQVSKLALVCACVLSLTACADNEITQTNARNQVATATAAARLQQLGDISYAATVAAMEPTPSLSSLATFTPQVGQVRQIQAPARSGQNQTQRDFLPADIGNLHLLIVLLSGLELVLFALSLPRTTAVYLLSLVTMLGAAIITAWRGDLLSFLCLLIVAGLAIPTCIRARKVNV